MSDHQTDSQPQLTVEAAYSQAVEHFNSGRYSEADQLCTAIIQAIPNHIDGITLLGAIAQKVERNDLAVELFLRAINIDNKRPLLYYNLGTSLFPLGEVERAVQSLKTALEMEPKNSQISDYLNAILKATTGSSGERESFALNQAMAMQQSGQLDAAINWYQNALAINPENGVPLSNMGLALHNKGRLDEAVASYQKALAINADNTGTLFNLGNVLKEQGKLDEAVTTYQKVISIKPDDADAYNNLAITLQELSRLDEAVASYQKALKIKPDYLEALCNLGVAFQEQGKLEKAVECYQEALKINPEYAEALYNLGNSLKLQGKLAEAASSYQKATLIQPSFANAYCSLGGIMQEQGKLAEAVECYQKAITINPAFANAYCYLGNTLKTQKELDAAVGCYQNAITINPNYTEACFNLGVTLHELGRLDEAVNCYQKAILLKPDYIDAYCNLGITLHEQGRLNEAIDSFHKAIEINPVLSTPYNNLGVSLKKQGRAEESFLAFRKAVEFYPDFPESLSNLGDELNKVGESSEIAIPFSEKLLNDLTPISELDAEVGNMPDKSIQDYSLDRVLREFARKKDGRSDDGSLRILLLHPPIWKISSPGEPTYPVAEGGHPINNVDAIDGDSKFTSYGLLSIAANVLKSGRKVLICNISNFTWNNVEKLIKYIDIDLVGITCMTYNLRGVGALSKLIREHHPKSHIVVGGSHPTALPKETLQHFQAIDTVVVGEGELTFLEIIERLEAKKPVHDVPGTVWRNAQNLGQFAQPRERIENLDELASPHDYFSLQMIITSRGCPFRCTFCGSESQWGSKLKMNSVEHILKMLEMIVIKKGVKCLAIKDDTFTAVRKRTLTLCHEIIKRELNFIWSCDTRINSLDEEVLRTMRMAGCQRISVGVESGSPTILKTIKKKLDPEKVVEVTKMARKYGIQVRFYMIVGNRGENLETFEESVQLIHDAKPSEFAISGLSISPGTEEYDIYQEDNNIDPNIFFDVDYDTQQYGYCDYVTGSVKDVIDLWSNCFFNNDRGFRHFSVSESQEILSRLDGLPSAHMDLAGAYLRAGEPDKAKPHVVTAMDNGYPLTDYAFNYLAAIAAMGGDFDTFKANLQNAMGSNRLPIITENYNRYLSFIKSGGAKNGHELKFIVHNNFPATLGKPLQPFQPVYFNLPEVK
ncbi:MAG: tetratricopeptide repeat protein [Magnetococcales bacterium]|nr:tetratricopeptide repeat protein [Magnetococcales bacterium]